MCLEIRLRRDPLPLSPLLQPYYWNLPGESAGCRLLPLYQLRVWLEFRGFGEVTGPQHDAIVSTSEPLTIIPRDIWQDDGEFENSIVWLEPRNRYELNTLGYPGPREWVFRDRYPFELGLIYAIAFDGVHELRPAPVIARFLAEPSPDIPEVIAGAEYGILTNRLLTRQSACQETTSPFDPPEWTLRDL